MAYSLKKPELLAPAGDYSRLVYAVEYGADAVYVGGEEFSLRSAAQNFTRDELERAVDYCHRNHVKLYVACNTVPRMDEMERLPEYAAFLQRIGVDAVIIADLGMLSVFRRCAPDLAIHVSTQANVVNAETCMMWYELGARRIVLARELSLEEIQEIRRRIPDDLELEAFVHGAMCMAHSGRCLLSSFLVGRDANRGDCAQPCRWKYALVEETRPNEYFPVMETGTGSFVFNSKDMCMVEHIPDLCNAGIASFKIEGRVKTEYYVAAVTSVYRRAIDECFDDISRYTENMGAYAEELEKISHREYFTGFYYGDPGSDGQNYKESSYVRNYELCGLIEGYDTLKRCLIVTQKNKFILGDTCEILEHGKEPRSFKITKMYDENMESILTAPHAEMRVYIEYPHYVGSHAFLRKRKI